jgi:hypothetical protein
MLTTVAALIIVFGLAVSLAREVRRRSAFEATRSVLRQLDAMVAAYQIRWSTTPPVPPLIADVEPDQASPQTRPSGGGETVAAPVSPTRAGRASSPENPQELLARLNLAAKRNNAAFVIALTRGGGILEGEANQLPRSMFDDSSLRDAWGNPIVFMPAMHPAIGMADDNRPFFFSAGPDGNYLTRVDNLYSYEGR